MREVGGVGAREPDLFAHVHLLPLYPLPPPTQRAELLMKQGDFNEAKEDFQALVYYGGGRGWCLGTGETLPGTHTLLIVCSSLSTPHVTLLLL